ncbi:sulfur carrier protein ThiS [Shouchella patagoniensis]|uniref:sulfur carrier protein ThiS n=1 Tax=Shouchella patagoniensis TaxID=228576 RepID=UPI000994C62A|nr:sulfur carrier protein ThiS [Shouchella patagoniensis]
MKIIVNGGQLNSKSLSLYELVVEYELSSQLVVAEVDGEIIDRSHWKETMLQEGMQIELVHFVGGG